MAQDEEYFYTELSASEIERAREVDMHIAKYSFFRNYIPGSVVDVNCHIGGYERGHEGGYERGHEDGYERGHEGGDQGRYPASIFGFWKPSVEDGLVCQHRAEFDPSDRRGMCYHPFTLHPAAKEIAFLLKCRDLPDTTFWRVAEEEWKKQMEAIQKIVDAKETKVTSLISEIYQLVGLAAAFQGLLITATAQLSTSNHSCSTGLWWFIALSAFATIVTATGVNYKVGLVGVFQKSLNDERPLLHERKRLLRKLTVIDGPGFDLKPHILDKPKLKKFKAFVKERIYSKLEYSSFILVALTVFGIICGFAIAFICK